MRTLLVTLLLTFSTLGWAQPPDRVISITLQCNWGQVTVEALQAEPAGSQGAHASDPSNDGHGPGTADEPRQGLANIIEQGNLEATCEFLSGQPLP